VIQTAIIQKLGLVSYSPSMAHSCVVCEKIEIFYTPPVFSATVRCDPSKFCEDVWYS